MATAVITGASRGFGEVLAADLLNDGWNVVIDARNDVELQRTAERLAGQAHPTATVVAIAGDVTRGQHRAELIAAAEALGGIDLLVNNASMLGPSPQPALADYPLDEWQRVFDVNVVAPLALTQLALPVLVPGRGRIINISSDAGVEAYEGWGGYGAAKAALDHLSRVLAVEHPDVGVYSVDPGDMRTAMHQDAFPGEDISDRPPPEASVPGVLTLVLGELPSGRYQARELAEVPA